MRRVNLGLLIAVALATVLTGATEAVGDGQSDALLAVMITPKGDIWLALFPEEAPLTVANFVNLAQRGFYDELTFHRVLPNFMIQGGDPEGTGRGGPGYKFKDEFSPGLRHDSGGILSMANSGPTTNGSQFFVTHKATPHLNDKHTIFGKVLQGQDVVDAIQQGDELTAVVIEGDPSSLLAGHQQQIDEWNRTLDDKYPGKSTALDGAKVSEIKSAAAAMRAKAEQIRTQIAEAGKEQKEAQAAVTKLIDEVRSKGAKTDSGLIYLDQTVGEGPSPEPTNRVTVHCTGWLTDGKKFYSSHDGKGDPISNVATGFVPGFNEGILTMKVGGKRKLLIPGELGYGPRGNARAGIPSNATLFFDVELLEIK